MKAVSEENSVSPKKKTIHPLVKKLLQKRGIEEEKDIDIFLSPDYERDTHDPFLLPDMERAVERILKAISEGEKIIIYSDYDADGIPGAVALSDFFKQIKYENVEVYIPHRHAEGFGLNDDAIEKFSTGKAGLIITIDCGSSGNGPVELANKLGIDVVITDHHIPSDPEPDAYALVNPKRKGSNYPFQELCGAAVAFKLVQALLFKLRTTNYDLRSIPPGFEKWLLDMVGIATLSDMVPLTGENRIFAKYGLLVLRKSRRPGIKALCRKLRLNQRHLTEDDIGFMITPRINAASRMDEPMDAFRLLSAEDDEEAGEYVDHLDRINNERKGLVASMVKEAKKRLDKINSASDVVVIGDPRWRTGLVGLAAQRIAEDYGRPAFVWGREGGDVIRGSARSPGSINVVRLMESCSDTFIEYGGHALSGGFSVAQEDIHTLEEVLVAACGNSEVQTVESNSESFFDDELSLLDVNWEIWDLIDKLSPFGDANPKPIFLFRNVLISEVGAFGKEKNHMKLGLEKPSGGKVEAMSFFKGPDDFKVQPKKGEQVDVLANMEKSMFRGRPELRLRIVDIL
jgi:single-stranded-DNA-specific exonuclease